MEMTSSGSMISGSSALRYLSHEAQELQELELQGRVQQELELQELELQGQEYRVLDEVVAEEDEEVRSL